jgi:hypothetical protein
MEVRVVMGISCGPKGFIDLREGLSLLAHNPHRL